MPESWPFPWGERTYLMGVLNVTPDSFSGDGMLASEERPEARAQDIQSAGADIVDVGGESTRPGHVRVPVELELERTVPAIRRIARDLSVAVSIDTRKAQVAHKAVEAGARIVNDVSGLSDPEMASVVAGAGVGLVVVHGHAAAGAKLLASIARDLEATTEKALSAGVNGRMIAVDPGLGFGKNWRQNLEIMRRLRELRSLGFPIVIGPSRKATISHALGVERDDRLEGTAALVAIGIVNGADVVRVHDVHFMREVARMTDALARPH